MSAVTLTLQTNPLLSHVCNQRLEAPFDTVSQPHMMQPTTRVVGLHACVPHLQDLLISSVVGGGMGPSSLNGNKTTIFQ
jgi:hypothetical protein